VAASVFMGKSATELLEAGAPGRVLTVFSDDVDSTKQALRLASEELAPSPTLVGLEWEHAPGLAREIDEIRDALADAARSLWPSWYTTVDQRFSDDAARSPELERLVQRLSTTQRVSVSWLRAAWTQCSNGRLPIVPHLAAAQQVRQLAQAIDPAQLMCVLSVTSPEATSARIRSLSRAAGWLAHEAQTKVYLLVPRAWQNHPELDHVTYGSVTHELVTHGLVTHGLVTHGVEHRDAPPPEPTAQTRTGALAGTSEPGLPVSPPEQRPRNDAPVISVGPICGRPHPKSYVEQTVHRLIQDDPELEPLFEFNQRLVAANESEPIVDLVWRDGLLVVELDGPEHHSPQMYVRDRDRDFQLMLRGYRVMRITNAEVLVDPHLAMIKIRSAVAWIRRSQLSKESNS
jgi:very-short-patch-repair endonuclease